jgi:hypothetical protein
LPLQFFLPEILQAVNVLRGVQSENGIEALENDHIIYPRIRANSDSSSPEISFESRRLYLSRASHRLSELMQLFL